MTPDDDPTALSDVDLLRRLHADHDEPEVALAALYDRYAGLVFGLSMRILRDRAEAEDVTHDVFLSLIERDRYDPKRAQFRTFLTLLTRSRAIDRVRSRSRAVSTRAERQIDEVLSARGPSPFDDAGVRENARLVSDAMSELSERQRTALEMAYYRGMSHSEIAGEMEAPLGTVKGLLRSGLGVLRRVLKRATG